MNKKEFIDAIALRRGMTKVDAAIAVNAFCDTIKELMLEDGVKVCLNGFGSFVPTEKPAHNARNPKNGEPCSVPATKSFRFTKSKTNRVIV